jgi:hypothetical protein
MSPEEKIKQLLAKTQIKVHSDLFSIVSIEKEDETKAKEISKNLTSFSSITFYTKRYLRAHLPKRSYSG